MVHRKAAHVKGLWKPYPPSNKILSFQPPNGENSSTRNIKQPILAYQDLLTPRSFPPVAFPPHDSTQVSQPGLHLPISKSSRRWDREFLGKPLWMSLLHIDIYTFFVHIIIYIYILFFRYTSKDVYTLNCWYNYFFIEIHKPKDWLLFRDSPHHFGWTSHYIVPFMWAHEIRFWQFLLRSDHWHKGQVFFLMIIRWITSSFSWIPCYPSSLRQPVHSTGRWHPSLGRCTAGFGFLRDDGLVQFSLPGTFKNSSLYRDTHGYTLWI